MLVFSQFGGPLTHVAPRCEVCRSLSKATGMMVKIFSMEHIPSREGDSHAAGEVNLRLLRNPKAQ